MTWSGKNTSPGGLAQAGRIVLDQYKLLYSLAFGITRKTRTGLALPGTYAGLLIPTSQTRKSMSPFGGWKRAVLWQSESPPVQTMT